MTLIKYTNTGGFFLQNWMKTCNDRNKNGKIQNFIKSAKTNSPTGNSGATSLPAIGNSFVYFETSSNILGNNVFVRFERADNIQITNTTFYYSRFSLLTKDEKKSTIVLK